MISVVTASNPLFVFCSQRNRVTGSPSFPDQVELIRNLSWGSKFVRTSLVTGFKKQRLESKKIWVLVNSYYLTLTCDVHLTYTTRSV